MFLGRKRTEIKRSELKEYLYKCDIAARKRIFETTLELSEIKAALHRQGVKLQRQIKAVKKMSPEEIEELYASVFCQ